MLSLSIIASVIPDFILLCSTAAFTRDGICCCSYTPLATTTKSFLEVFYIEELNPSTEKDIVISHQKANSCGSSS